jgi:hypothetical protein
LNGSRTKAENNVICSNQSFASSNRHIPEFVQIKL